MVMLRFPQSVFFVVLAGIVALATPSPAGQARAQSPCPDPGKFGCFEVLHQLPVIGDLDITERIDDFARRESPLVDIANLFFQIGLVVLIMVGLICVVIGGYIYMTAGGSSERIGAAKKWIGAALIGITIGLVGWLILNTISPQFTSEVREPVLACENHNDCPLGATCFEGRCVSNEGVF